MTDTFYLADEDDPEVVLFSDFIALLGITPVYPGSFFKEGSPDLGSAWDDWRKNWFAPHFGPAFTSVFQLATAQKVNEIAEIDRDLERELTASRSAKSRAAAHAFLEGKSEMQANREWQRLARLIGEKETPGHLTTLFAFQSALYHLPLASALRSYARYEFHCGRTSFSRLDSAEETQIFQRILPDVAVAVKANLSDNTDSGNQLRAI
ncbi:MAG: hypothetical protein P1U86_22265 [Verrucomicrobiales bacterium]|nr:hypothetical protein [Verrucomicrobiales bacterium]